jgi:hypothetical protein
MDSHKLDELLVQLFIFKVKFDFIYGFIAPLFDKREIFSSFEALLNFIRVLSRRKSVVNGPLLERKWLNPTSSSCIRSALSRPFDWYILSIFFLFSKLFYHPLSRVYHKFILSFLPSDFYPPPCTQVASITGLLTNKSMQNIPGQMRAQLQAPNAPSEDYLLPHFLSSGGVTTGQGWGQVLEPLSLNRKMQGRPAVPWVLR